MGPFQNVYRPALAPRAPQALQGTPRLGAVGSLTVTDWLLLLGGAVVGGAGVNSVYRQFTGPKRKKPDAITIALGVVFAAVGLSVMVDEGKKALA